MRRFFIVLILFFSSIMLISCSFDFFNENQNNDNNNTYIPREDAIVDYVTINGLYDDMCVIDSEPLTLTATVYGNYDDLGVEWFVECDEDIVTIDNGVLDFYEVDKRTKVEVYAYSIDDNTKFDKLTFYVVHSETGEVEYNTNYYLNPLEPTLSSGSSYWKEVADPTVVRDFETGYIYVFSTGGKIFKSEDGVTFTIIDENCIGSPTWWDEVYQNNPGAGLWAPDVEKIGDKWICYYSLSAWGRPIGIGYAVADNIEGPYKDMGKLFTYVEIDILNAIDPHVIIDDDGRVYMSVGSFQGLYLVELTEDGMGLKDGASYQKSNKVLIAGEAGNKDWDGSTYEGSYIIKKDGYYYYFGSVGTCCEGVNSTYHVRVGRSRSIFGPYIDRDGHDLTESGNGRTYGEIVCKTPEGVTDYCGPGHNSILVDDAGEYWIYYHGYSKHDNYSTRHMFLDKLLWDSENWPYLAYEGYDANDNYVEGEIAPSYQILIEGPRFL